MQVPSQQITPERFAELRAQELSKLKEIVEDDAKIEAWMAQAWAEKHVREIAPRLPRRFRNMISKGSQIKVQIPTFPVPTPAHIASVRTSIKARIADLEKTV